VDIAVPSDPRANVAALLAAGEGSQLEYKRQLPADAGQKRGKFKPVAPFATGDGGIMVFGIDPDELTVTGLNGEDPKSSGTACMAWCTAPWSRRRTLQSKTTRWTGRPSWCSTWHPDPRPPIRIAVDKGSRDKPEFYVRRGSSTYPAR
jgi:hypothetical protein